MTESSPAQIKKKTLKKRDKLLLKMPQTTANSKRSLDTTSPNTLIKLNPFFDDFVDCIENLPSRLQLLLSELRNVDVLVKARHRKLHAIKQEIITITENAENEETKKEMLDQLLNKLHQLLVQCQTLGDQKVRLTGQIIEIIGAKTRQLGFDARSNEAKFNLDIDEEKILSEFKQACRENRPIHHHYNVPGSSGPANGSRSSTRHIHQNLSNKPKNFQNQNEHTNQFGSTRSKRQLNFSTTNSSNDVPKKTLNQSLKLNKKRRISLNKTTHQSSSSSSSSNQCKSPSSLSSSSSTSIYKTKYLTNNNANNTNNQSNHNTNKSNSSQTSNLLKAQKENIKYNTKLKNNQKTVKRLKGKRKRLKKTDDEECNDDDEDDDDVDMERDYESDDEISPESEHETEKDSEEKRKEVDVKKEIKNEELVKDDQSDRNSNDTESINNLEDEEQDHDVETDKQDDKLEDKASKSKRIKQENDQNDDEKLKKKSTRTSRNNLNLSETNTITNKVIKSAHDEPLYCLCREISYGQMIMCDNDACKIEWFHFNCVKLMSKPKGKWYCPQCRGENHKVMKKSHLINQPSTSSNLSSPNYYNNYQSSYSNRMK